MASKPADWSKIQARAANPSPWGTPNPAPKAIRDENVPQPRSAHGGGRRRERGGVGGDQRGGSRPGVAAPPVRGTAPGPGTARLRRSAHGSSSGSSSIVAIVRSKGSIVQVSTAPCSIGPTRAPTASRQAAGATRLTARPLAGEPGDRRLRLPRAERFELVVPLAHQDHAPGHPRVVAPEARPLVGQGVVQREQAGAGGLAQPGTERTDGQRVEGDHGGTCPRRRDRASRASDVGRHASSTRFQHNASPAVGQRGPCRDLRRNRGDVGHRREPGSAMLGPTPTARPLRRLGSQRAGAAVPGRPSAVVRRSCSA